MVLMIINLLFTGWVFFGRDQPKKLVIFDLKGTMNLFFSQVKANHLSDEKMLSTTKQFTDALDSSVKEYSDRHHVVVLVSGAVISGAEDITKILQSDIASKMAN